jgi:hypothetical protein
MSKPTHNRHEVDKVVESVEVDEVDEVVGRHRADEGVEDPDAAPEGGDEATADDAPPSDTPDAVQTFLEDDTSGGDPAGAPRHPDDEDDADEVVEGVDRADDVEVVEGAPAPADEDDEDDDEDPRPDES